MAKSHSLVSVLVPAFNAGATIQQALSSLVAQTFEDWEAVLVDDGSVDGTWERAATISDSRIRRFRLEKNVGRGAARQFALRHSTGSFVCMQDADDWCYPWKLERQLEALEEYPDASVVSSAMASIGKDGSLVGIWRHSTQHGDAKLMPPVVSLLDLRLPHAPCMIRADLAREFEYCSKLLRAEEYHYLARVLKNKRFLVLGEALYAYPDQESFLREGPVPRYLWSARASLKLARRFPMSASYLAARKTLQAVLALSPVTSRFGSRTKPWPPTPEEASKFERARREVDEVMARA